MQIMNAMRRTNAKKRSELMSWIDKGWITYNCPYGVAKELLQDFVVCVVTAMTNNDTTQNYEFLNSFVKRLVDKIGTKTESKNAQNP